MSEWISIKDRLPQVEQDCDIFVEGWGRLTDCMYADYEEDNPRHPHFYREESDDIIEMARVTHWIPLPDDPK